MSAGCLVVSISRIEDAVLRTGLQPIGVRVKGRIGGVDLFLSRQAVLTAQPAANDSPPKPLCTNRNLLSAVKG